MKEKECNFAMLNQQRMVTLTRNTNGLKNGTHYNSISNSNIYIFDYSIISVFNKKS